MGVGFTLDGKRNSIEIIDLESSTSVCSNLKDFPEPTHGAIGGLAFNNNPLICGGYKTDGIAEDCFSWQNSGWQVFEPLTEKKVFASSCPSPFPNETHKLLLAGGRNDSGGYIVLMN